MKFKTCISLTFSFFFLCILKAEHHFTQVVDQKIYEQALNLHHNAIVMDAHSHPMKDIFSEPGDLELGKDTHKSHLNLITMKKGGLDAFFMALPLPNDLNKDNILKKILYDTRLIKDHIDQYSNLAELAFTSFDIDRIHDTGKRAIMLSIEFDDVLNGNIPFLKTYYQAGIRSMTLWGRMTDPNNNLSNQRDEENGLNQYEKEVIEEMNRLGMLIDITHCDDTLQIGILKTSKAPVMASHSCCRALNDISRNIPDHILTRIAENNGAIMIDFSSLHISSDYNQKFNKIRKEFMDNRRELKEKYKNNKSEHDRQREFYENNMLPPSVDIELLIDHIDHAVKTAGINHVGLGSDFIGKFNASGLQTTAGYPLVTYHLMKRGYKKEDIRKILGGNLIRIIREVEKIADNQRF